MPFQSDIGNLVTNPLIKSSNRYWEQLQVSIVFPGNEFSSFLGSQLSSDHFRNVGQALLIPLKSSQPSSILALILGLDVFFRSASPELKKWKADVRNELSSRLDTEVPVVYPRAEVVEGRRAFCRQTLVQRDRWL